MAMKNPFKRALEENLETLETLPSGSTVAASLKAATGVFVLLAILAFGLGFYWSREPALPNAELALKIGSLGQPPVTGTQTLQALIFIGETLSKNPVVTFLMIGFRPVYCLITSPIGNLVPWFKCATYPARSATILAALNLSLERIPIW